MTTLVGIFKHENKDISPKEVNMNVMKAYHVLWKAIKLPNMKMMAFILLTAKVYLLIQRIHFLYQIILKELYLTKKIF